MTAAVVKGSEIPRALNHDPKTPCRPKAISKRQPGHGGRQHHRQVDQQFQGGLPAKLPARQDESQRRPGSDGDEDGDEAGQQAQFQRR